jgi:Trypsin-like peptidase domain
MDGSDAATAGIDPTRVAELLVMPVRPGPGRRGSGYRVSASAVLTAAHVVHDAATVRVRFDADRPTEWLTDGTVAWSDEAVDVAVVTIAPRPEEKRGIASVEFGQVTERDAVLRCSAMGFPRFKLRNDPAQPTDDGNPSQYRDSVHAVGSIAVLSNRRQGTLEVSVSPPGPDPDPRRSPWEGMSGAAVWSAGRIIGLVAEHHPSDGLGRLAATRVDRWYERLPRDQLDELRRLLPRLPVSASVLVDVVPASPSDVVVEGYLAEVRDIAPERLAARRNWPP